MDKRRVVITGMGLVSPVGNDVESSFKALVEGKKMVLILLHFLIQLIGK